MIPINYVYSIGFNCNAARFMMNNGLRKFASPFDWMHTDFESALENINTNFENYLSDLIHIKQDSNVFELVYKKNLDTIPKQLEFKDKLSYMTFSYYDHNLFVNGNYISEDLSSNVYDWSKVQLWLHHDLLNEHYINTIKHRVERFKNLYNKYYENSILLHLGKIETVDNFTDYKNNVINIVKKNNIKSYVIKIVCSDNLEEQYIYEDRCLIIVKKVPNYTEQTSMRITENDTSKFDFTKEFQIIKQYFSFDSLVSHDDAEHNW